MHDNGLIMREICADEHKKSLVWLKDYFGDERPKETALRMIRDKTAFRYDKLNLDQAIDNLPEERKPNLPLAASSKYALLYRLRAGV
jgi:hypothetical protein